jgi:hypothetical protein
MEGPLSMYKEIILLCYKRNYNKGFEKGEKHPQKIKRFPPPLKY